MSKLPEGWVKTTLGEIRLDDGEGINPARFPTEEFELYSVPSHATGDPEIVVGASIGSNKQTVSDNTVLLCKINPRINRVWVVEPRTSLRRIASTEWIAFSPKPGILPDYLAYFLRQTTVRDYLAQHASGVGGSLMRVKPSTFSHFPFYLAPRNEQCQIVDEIEKQFTRLDAATAALKRVQANLKRYRASVLKAACEGRLVPNTSDTDGYPKSPVLELLSRPLANGRSPQSTRDGCKILRLTAIRDGSIDMNEWRRGQVTESWLENLSIKQGDILVSRGNGSKALVGLAGLVGDTSTESEPILFPDTMIRIRLNAAVCDARFFVMIWNSRIVRDQIESTARTTAGIHKIAQTDIERFEIPLPSLKDQLAIVAVAEKLLTTLKHTTLALEMLTSRSSSLRASILSAAFTGQLVPQNPTDEPASALLERIRAARVESSKKTAARKSAKKRGKR
jgi:type I restriction enzyme S subunit